MYLEDEMNKLFEMYPKSFDKESKSLLNTLAKNGNKINYKNLSYKKLFFDGRFHEISFLNKNGTLYSLLKDVATRKTTVDIANADQNSFIHNLMHGYNVWDFDKKTKIKSTGDGSHSTTLAIADDVFLNSNKIFKKGIKSFFPTKYRKIISQEQKGIFINAMQLYNGRNTIIRIFKNRNIRLLCMYTMQNLNQKSFMEYRNQGRNLRNV